jgi:hypothetical protein
MPIFTAIASAILGALAFTPLVSVLGIGGLSFLAKALTALASSFVLSAVSRALTPKPPSPSVHLSGRTVTVREPTTARKIVYGQTRTGGPVVFIHTTGGTNRFLHLIVCLAGHEVEEIGDILFNDEVVPVPAAGGAVTSGKYNGKVWVYKHKGEASQTVDTNLKADAPSKWTDDHRLRGIAYIYAKLAWGPNIFGPIGMPNITAVVKGKKVFDPRTSTTVYSDNAALCIADYLSDSKYGLGAAYGTEIDNTALSAAANICDEFVTLDQASTSTFTADAATDILTLADAKIRLNTGTRFRVSSGGALPGGLSAGVDYYWIAISAKTGKAASSLANARAGTAIDLTSAGTGAHTATRQAEPRYTLNGVVDTERSPKDNIEEMLTALGGNVVYSSGLWGIFAAAYRTPAVTLTESDLRGPIQLQTKVSRRENFNGVKGVYADPQSAWQPTDLPQVTSAAYLAEDENERVWKDAVFPYTVSPSMGQRLMKIELERARKQITLTLPCKLTAFRIGVPDVVQVTNARMGWAAKPFEVKDWRLTADEDANGQVALGVDLTMRETASTVYDWASTEETTPQAAATTDLPDPTVVSDPTGLQLASGTAQLYLRLDGTVFSRIKASWTAPADEFVTSGGRIEIQYKKNADSTWLPSEFVDGGVTETYILDVQDGVSYDVRIRAVNNLGVAGNWVQALNHTVVGKTAAPSNVANFSAQQNGSVVTFRWDQVADLDLAGYEIRYMASPFIWENAIELTSVTRGTLITNAGLPPGSWVVGVKARDTSGNYSAAAATYAITVSNTNDIVNQQANAPDWPGTKTNFIRHSVSGRLVPDSQSLASAVGFEIFDQFVYNPYAQSEYEGAEIDLGFDAEGVRVWAEAGGGQGPGQTGSFGGVHRLDYRKEADAYDGFEDWTIGTVTARRFKNKFRLDNTAGQVGYLSAFKPTIDLLERTESEAGRTIAAGGTAIVFGQRFINTPAIQVTAQPSGGAARIATYESPSATGFTAKVFNTAGADVGGTVDWAAIGV